MTKVNLNQLSDQVGDWINLRFWKEVYIKKQIKQSILDRQRLSGREVFPPPELWFRALEYTQPKDVKCVILGQDPYHTKGLSHGLAFSVMPDVRTYPPTLRNILNEYQDDLGYPRPINGYLRPWADNGVLLLNTCLTVDQGKPLSHKDLYSWELLTYEILRVLDQADQETFFIFWGKQSQQFLPCITNPKHGVLCSAHPSPLSFNAGARPFRGSKPFSAVNKFLESAGRQPIRWRLAG